jgi:MoxR-vWA-beta-propeller ternary system domain bpX4
MDKTKSSFLDTIYHLRTIEQIILSDKLLTISKEEEKDTISFLEAEYEREILEYPGVAPEFKTDAALWAAKTVYLAAQLLLYREHKITDLEVILADFDGNQDASAVLSADLCLRFLPQIIEEMKRIDPDDLVIPILEKHLYQFHYSSIGFEVDIKKINFDIIASNDCLQQLYIDRIVHRKAIKFTESDFIKKELEIGFGDYKKIFWAQL